MKRSLIKISIYCIALAAILTSCLKGDDMNTPPGGAGGAMIAMSYVDLANTGTNLNSGLRYFGKAALTYPSTDVADTATFWVTLQGASLGKDLNVTLKVDASAKSDYYSSDSIVYLDMPDSLYSFLGPTSTVINAGKTYAEFKVIFYPSKIDASQNYILPLTATNDSNVPTSSNYAHIYFHAIGNPLAGAYNWIYHRYNAGDTTGSITTTINGSQTFVPDNPTTVEVQSGYGKQNAFNARYLLTFNSKGGVLTNFKVKINPDDVTNSLTFNSITLTQDAIIIAADPVKKHFRFTFKVKNSAGSPRSFTDDYVKP